MAGIVCEEGMRARCRDAKLQRSCGSEAAAVLGQRVPDAVEAWATLGSVGCLACLARGTLVAGGGSLGMLPDYVG
jgi:hypothetical protein